MKLDPTCTARDPLHLSLYAQKSRVQAALFGTQLEPERRDHYVLLRRLGSGAMGSVYEAYDETLARTVALKFLAPASQADREREVLEEARAMARLEHPNVVRVYDVELSGDQSYIVMELVRGQTICQWMKQDPPHADRLSAFIQAGRGLAAAHEAGIVHRDFKPDNVMIASDRRILVVDFGLARDEPDPRGRSEPRGGSGTPAYMAPEVLTAATYGPKTDQFSFCVSLWEALHGTRPFAGRTRIELHESIHEQAIVPGLVAGVPPWIRPILERGLAYDPADRWPSMSALLDALNNDPTRRRRRLRRLCVVGGLALASTGTVYFERAWTTAAIEDACERDGSAILSDWSDDIASDLRESFIATGATNAESAWSHASTQLEDYARAWSALRTRVCREHRLERARSDESREQAVACLDERRAGIAAAVELWRDADQHVVQRAATLAATLRPISSCGDDEQLSRIPQPDKTLLGPVRDARARVEKALILRHAGRFDEALAEANALLETSKQTHWRPLEAEARLSIAKAQDGLGEFDEARRSASQAYTVALSSGHDLVALHAARLLGTITTTRLSQPEQGERWLQVAAALVDRLDLSGTMHQGVLLNEHGVILRKRGDHQEALASYSKALPIYEQELGREHPAVASLYHNIAIAHSARGQYETALTMCSRALELKKAVLGEVHLSVAATLSTRGNILEHLNDFDVVIDSHRRALEITEALLGPDHYNLAVHLNNLGRVLKLLDEYDEAALAFERARRILEHKLGPEHPTVAGLLHNLGDLALNLRDFDDALMFFDQSLAIYESGPEPDHSNVAYPLEGLGRTYLALAEPAQAIPHLERALALRKRAQLSPKYVAILEYRLARAYWALSRPNEARALALEALANYRRAGAGAEMEVSEVAVWLGERKLR